ncbi:MAG: efflux RND transporter periplasmic adaptor subunit [Lentisphaerae bacterium]|nr:efflux RND transporter periplasmic adaptor subunit [Lentisphaerota bacterium]
MKHRRIVFAAAALAILGALAILAWPRIKKIGAKAPPGIKTAVIQRGNITQVVTANGQLEALKTVTVGSQLSGKITEIMVDFNDRVTNGQVIAQIDPSNAQQQLLEAEAQLSSARASMDLAALNLQRARDLFKEELISKADFDKTQTEWRQAEASVKTRDAAVNRVKVDLSHATIYSPIDGVVISRAVDVGQTVAASLNAPTLFTIAQDLSKMRIEANVSEADVGGVKEGQNVNFTVDAFPTRSFSGQVTQVRYEPVINQNVVNYIAIVDVDNEDLKLRPGMTANASIITAQRLGALRIPNAGLRFRPPDGVPILPPPRAHGKGPGKPDLTGATPSNAAAGGFAGEKRNGGSALPPAGSGQNGDGEIRTVYFARTNENKVALVPAKVEIGITDGAWTEVVSGLKEGDAIATGISSVQAPPAAAATGNPFAPTSPMGRRRR